MILLVHLWLRSLGSHCSYRTDRRNALRPLLILRCRKFIVAWVWTRDRADLVIPIHRWRALVICVQILGIGAHRLSTHNHVLFFGLVGNISADEGLHICASNLRDALVVLKSTRRGGICLLLLNLSSVRGGFGLVLVSLAHTEPYQECNGGDNNDTSNHTTDNRSDWSFGFVRADCGVRC